MSVTTTNGPPRRKQLSDQLDRLDSIIDLLAQALPAAVAEAAREGTRQAVKDAILEILSNPELRGLIGSVSVPPAPLPLSDCPAPASAPSIWSKIKAQFGAAKAAVVDAVRPVVAGVVEQCATAAAVVTNAVQTVARLLPWKKIVFLSLAVGAGIGAVSYLAPHTVSAVISGVCGATTSVVVQLAAWTRRYLRLCRFDFV